VQELLDGLALKHLGMASIDSNYQRVLQAAQSVGLGDEYAAWNKHLSKFAHPSAFVVIGVMSNGNFTRHFQSINTSVGVSFCHRCVTAFEKIESRNSAYEGEVTRSTNSATAHFARVKA
jgi:hypothetical protein